MPKPKDGEKCITLRLPDDLWRRCKLAIIDGRLISINSAAIAGLEKILEEKNKRDIEMDIELARHIRRQSIDTK